MKNGTALITGASSGIGEVFARKLSKRGHHLILVARRKDRLEKLASELGNCEIIAADLALDSELHCVEERIAAEPDLDFLVNNAGFGTVGGFHEVALESQDQMHRLHVIATERLTHAAIRVMLKRGQGNIINVSSVAGFFATPFNASYCATKAWMNSFTEGLSLEAKSMNLPIRIQALCPGFTHTEFHDAPGLNRGAIPRALWMSADFVVEESLRGLLKNKTIVIPSWKYRSFVAIYRHFPQRLKHVIAIRYGNARKT